MSELLVAALASGWVLPVLFAFAVLDGFVPPVPSETAVVALAAAAAAGQPTPPVALIVAVAAVGALVGDQAAYWVGVRLGSRSVSTGDGWLARGARRLGHVVRRRGGPVFVVARFIPGGRVAASLTAGATGFGWPAFTAWTATGAVTWAGVYAVIGSASGTWLGGHPLVAIAVAVLVVAALGLGVDAVVRRRSRASAPSGNTGDVDA